MIDPMNRANNFKFVFLALVAAVIALAASCSKQLDYSELASKNGITLDGSGAFKPDALVTIKPLPGGESYFQLDDSTTLEPVGWKNPYRKEIRALINFNLLNKKSEKYSHCIQVTRVDTIRTKDAVCMRLDKNVSTRDIEPVHLITDWLTVCEDGYMTIHFSAKWGDVSSKARPHLVNLVINPDNPREMEFVHSVNGDYNGTVWRDGLVAFKISDLLTGIKEDEVILTLKWLAYDSMPNKKELKLVYRVRRQ
jgi:hypothetical protein